jgi:hypothetical protein
MADRLIVFVVNHDGSVTTWTQRPGVSARIIATAPDWKGALMMARVGGVPMTASWRVRAGAGR